MPNQPDVAAELERVTAERDQAWRDALTWRRRTEAIGDAVRALHDHDGNGNCTSCRCDGCASVHPIPWPCPTVLAVEQAEEEVRV